MPRGFSILVFFLAIGTASAAGEEFVVLDDGSRIPIRKAIPVLVDSSEPATLHTTATSPRSASNPHNALRTNHQGFRVDYRIAQENSPQVGYELNAGFNLIDSLTGEPLEPARSKFLQIGHGGYLRWTGPNRLELKLATGLEALARDSQSLQEHSVYQRGNISYPLLRHTSIKSSFASIDRHRLDGSILGEDSLSASLEQRLPPLPLRLTLTQATSWHSLQDSPGSDVERQRLLASAHWNIATTSTLSIGVESSTLSREASDSTETTSLGFTEIRFAPLPQVGLRLRATAEERDLPGSGPDGLDTQVFLPSISASLDIQVAPGFETGIGILYRPNDPATPSNPSPAPARITIFGSSLF